MNGDKKKIIRITGACQGAGATFVATALAFTMAQYEDGITYLEGGGHASNHAMPFYELSLDRHISRRRFADFFALKAAGQPTDNRVNLYANVNWVVRAPNCEPRQGGIAPGSQQQANTIHPTDVAGRYILWDDGNFVGAPALHGAAPPLCTSATAAPPPDLTLCVIDPRPSRLQTAAPLVSALAAEYQSGLMWVFNRVPSQQAAREAERALKLKADFVIPIQPSEDFYKAERAHVHLADSAVQKSKLLPRLSPESEATFKDMAQTVLTLY